MDIMQLERIFNAVDNVPIDRFIDVDKLNKEVERFGERYKKRYLDKLETRVNDAQGKAKEALTKGNSALDKAGKFGQELKDKMAGVDRATKGLQKFMNVLSGVLGVAGLAISLMALKASEANQAAFDRQIDRFQIDASKQLSLLQTQKFRIDKANAEIKASNKQIDILKREADLASDAIKLSRSWADRAYKLANDGLFESRTKIKRLNDVVAEARSNASKALVQNTALKSNVVAVQGKIKTIEVKATTIASDLQQAKAGIKLIDSKATTALTTAQQLPAKVPALAAPAINNAIAPVKAQVQQAQQVALKAEAANPPQNERIKALENKVTALQNVPKTNTPTTSQPNTNTPTINRAEVNQAVNQSILNMGILPRLKAAETTANTALQVASAPKPNIEPIGRSALAIGTNNTAAIDKLNRDVQQLKAPNVLEPRIKEVETKLKERENVDAAANQKLDRLLQDRSKLDQLLTLGVAIPVLAANAVNNQLAPQIQQLPGATATAVAAAPCNGKGCGGRTAQRVDDLAGEMGQLRNQVNSLPNNVGNVVNGLNLGANAEQLSRLGRIEKVVNQVDSKLGVTKLAGGISGMLDKMVKSSAADKALQVVTFLAALHNAYFLSSNLGQTFFSLSSNGINLLLRTMGIQSADDSPIDVGQIINQQIDDLAKQTFGVSTWQGIKREWAALSRVYQAASNMLFSVQGMFDSARQVASWTAENTGKIGNALKKWGVIPEGSYGWMSERVDAASVQQRSFDRFINGVQGLEETASSLDSVIGSATGVLDGATQFVEARKEFDKAVKEATPKERPDNDPVKAAVTAAKAVSAGAVINPADTLPAGVA